MNISSIDLPSDFSAITMHKGTNQLWLDWWNEMNKEALPLNKTLGNNNTIPRIIYGDTWIAPPPGCVKVNSDVSFGYSSNLCYLASVCRSSEGKLLWAATEGGMAKDGTEGESLGLELGIRMTKAKQESCMTIETDCRPLVDIISKGLVSGDLDESWRGSNIAYSCLETAAYFAS